MVPAARLGHHPRMMHKRQDERGRRPGRPAGEDRMTLAQVLRRQPSRVFTVFVLTLGTALLLALLWSLDVQHQGHLLGWM